MTQGALAGRVAIVTGAGTGVGTAIARLYAQEGAAVVLFGRRAALLHDTANRITAAGHDRCLVVSGDVSQEAAVDALFAQTLDRFGRVDILVNNAAVAGPTGPIWDLSLADFQETIAINLGGPWLCCRAAAKVMRPQRSGRIINIGSITGKRPLAARSPYAASKLGLVGLTRTLAVELGESNITVNHISPGPIDTPRLEELAKAKQRPLQEFITPFIAASALKRISRPEDIAELALFLAGDRAGNITGVDINVDGGIWFS